MKNVSFLITDLDNTLYDWFDAWYKSFRAMLTVLVETSGIKEEVLIPEIKKVHEQHGTAEYLRLIQEIPSLAAKHPGEDVTKIHARATQAYRDARQQNLRLYPSVLDTLKAIKSKGAFIVGYTESQSFYSEYRVRTLGLDGVIDCLYSSPTHDLPDNLPPDQEHFYPFSYDKLERTARRRTPKGAVKPSPDVLLTILKDLRADKEETVYVGDDKSKDIVMAQAAGVTDVHAAYGVVHSKKDYDLLRAVTNWPKEQVEKQKRDSTIIPSHELRSSFSELLNLFNFSYFAPRSA
jgi:phosphoglycolate phosphatase